MWPCGTITLTDELYLAESKSQVYGSIHSFMQTNAASTSTISTLLIFLQFRLFTSLYWTPEFIVYDDGCHLRKYAANPKRRELTPTTRKIADTEIVVDKMHFKGHIDQWCKRFCNPYNFPELETVNLITMNWFAILFHSFISTCRWTQKCASKLSRGYLDTLVLQDTWIDNISCSTSCTSPIYITEEKQNCYNKYNNCVLLTIMIIDTYPTLKLTKTFQEDQGI